jgi:hypothetical protein
MNSTRPAVSLSEALSMSELEHILLLTSNMEYNHGNVAWGGSWAGHSITCLLQDILEGMLVLLEYITHATYLICASVVVLPILYAN